MAKSSRRTFLKFSATTGAVALTAPFTRAFGRSAVLQQRAPSNAFRVEIKGLVQDALATEVDGGRIDFPLVESALGNRSGLRTYTYNFGEIRYQPLTIVMRKTPGVYQPVSLSPTWSTTVTLVC